MVYLYMWLEIHMIYMYHIYIARYVHTHKRTKFYTPQTSEHKFHFLKMYSSFKQYFLATVSPPSAPPSSPCNLPSPRSTPQFPFRKEQAPHSALLSHTLHCPKYSQDAPYWVLCGELTCTIYSMGSVFYKTSASLSFNKHNLPSHDNRLDVIRVYSFLFYSTWSGGWAWSRPDNRVASSDPFLE